MGPSVSPYLLSAETYAAAKKIALAQIDNRLSILVGAGLSAGIGLPDWATLLERLISRQKARGQSPLVGKSVETIIRAFGKAFADDLMRADALMSLAGEDEFSRDLHVALYAPEGHDLSKPLTKTTLALDPSTAMLHLVAFASLGRPKRASRICTLNFDDLLEAAGQRVLGDEAVYSVTPGEIASHRGLAIAHLHGYLPRLGSAKERVILAQRDFHALRDRPTTWTYRTMLSMFEEQSVLMVGIGARDPNVRQVLDLADGTPEHYVLRTPRNTRQHGGGLAEELERGFWQARRANFVMLRGWSELPGFLLALRHEAAIADGRSLWTFGEKRVASLLGAASTARWTAPVQANAASALRALCDSIRSFVGVPAAIEMTVGLFLPSGDGETLDLVFRSNLDPSRPLAPGDRRIRATPGEPQGIAGLAYASAALVVASRGAPAWDFGFDDPMRQRWEAGSHGGYEEVACAPIFDWDGGRGAPLGVAYVTASKARTLADSPALQGAGTRVLEESYLGSAVIQVLESLQ